MSATSLIIFRETLEIFIITGIVAAATKGLAGRNRYISSGLILGFIASCGVALLASQVEGFAQSMGKKLFHGGILLVAAALIAYTVVWMQGHAAEFKQKVVKAGEQIKAGERTKFTITLIILLAVLREGSEIVIFVFAEFAKGVEQAVIIRDGIIGFVSGLAVGAVIYFGLIKLPLKSIFKVMNILLTLLAAGLAASGIKKLYSGGFIDFLTQPTWDLTQSFMTEKESFGKILHIMFGWDDNPILLQLVVYAAVVGAIMFFNKKIKQKHLTN